MPTAAAPAHRLGRFGARPGQSHLEDPPEDQASTLQRVSADSTSSGAANEQAEAAGREARRREPPPPRRHQLPAAVQGPPQRLDSDDGHGVLGTWAGRQRIFAEHLKQQQEEEERQRRLQQEQQEQQEPPPPPRQQRAPPPPAIAEDVEVPQAYAAGETPVVLGAAAPAGAAGGALPEPSLDAEMNAAWRWRFTRKWQAEQMKQFEAPAAEGGGEGEEEEEEWAQALRMMAHVEGGLNMQIGRTLSLVNSSVVDSSLDHSLTLMSPGLSQCMLLDGSIKEVGEGGGGSSGSSGACRRGVAPGDSRSAGDAALPAC